MQYTNPLTAFSTVNRMCVIRDRKWIRREFPRTVVQLKEAINLYHGMKIVDYVF